MYTCEELIESSAADQYQSSCTPDEHSGYIGASSGSGNVSANQEGGVAAFQDDFDGYGGERKAGSFEYKDGPTAMVREGGLGACGWLTSV